MMEYFVTLFDSLYLPQGLTLYRSLEKYIGNYVLWVLCMDNKTKEILDKLNLEKIKTISLNAVETEELLNAKKDRSIVEYCWTLTPQTPKIVFDREPDAKRVTYIDADMFFLNSPQPIFSEFERSGKAVLFTEHAYSPDYDHSATCGKYCVQFMTFNRKTSESFYNWWAEKCIEWCYSYKEDNKFGDQKYLELWPQNFPDDIHVLEQKELILAPWNAMRFPYSSAIAWHFHGLKILPNNKVLLWSDYELPIPTIYNIYYKYINELSNSINVLKLQSFSVQPQGNRMTIIESVRNFVKSIRNYYLKRPYSITKIDNS